MATLGPPSPPCSPPLKRRSKGYVRKCERYCWTTLTYTPLVFVYGLTTWAIWVEVTLSFNLSKTSWTGYTSSLIGLILYSLLNWSYTVAVFTDPGSPLNSANGYTHLPTHEPQSALSFTVKSTGGTRFCKKCQARKPDRAHHCSTCKRCVLKMDHHCPWLAACVGLRNYKPFLLFLIYTTFFCWMCFAVSMGWAWTAILRDGNFNGEELMPVNYVLLTVISGIIGLVLTGFTAWHLSLACRGQTTIECLEQTRYLSPLRKSMHQQHQHDHQTHLNPSNNMPSYGQQLLDIHTNALPGVLRPEEGEERPSPTTTLSRAQHLQHRSYNEVERSRERQRYSNYLDEQDSEKLPNAFDLGVRRNLSHLFGETPIYWLLPLCNTTGDGWHWEASAKWTAAREGQWRDQHTASAAGQEGEYDDGWGNATVRRYPPPSEGFQPSNAEDRERHFLPREESLAYTPDEHQYMTAENGAAMQRPNSGLSMRTLRSPKSSFEDEDLEGSSDEDESPRRANNGGRWKSANGQGKRLIRGRERDGWDSWHEDGT